MIVPSVQRFFTHTIAIILSKSPPVKWFLEFFYIIFKISDVGSETVRPKGME